MATILVVDDHSVNREFLTTLLGYGSHRLMEAADGITALRMARETRPDLVISDILMPAGDGYELVRALRQDPVLAAVPVIFYTAHYNGREALHLAEACGVHTVLTKPADPVRVLEVVEDVLRDAGGGRRGIADADAFDRSHLRLVSQKLLQTTDELEWTTSRLMALIDMSLQLSSERDPQRLIGGFCRWTRELVGARSVTAGVWSPPPASIAYVAANGLQAAVNDEVERELRRSAPNPAPLSVREAAVRISGPMKDASVLGLPAAHPPVASAMVALVASPTHRFGWICAANRVGRSEFSEDDERLLVLFASYVGRIFENHCLVEEGAARSRVLEREIARRAEAQWRVDIQYAVARALSETSSVELAARDLLEAICTRSSFEIGELWEVDPDATQLRQVAVWHDDPAVARRFEHVSRDYAFARGVGMPGRVWETGQPVWIGDAQHDPLFLRAARAREFGVRAAVAFPVVARGTVVGVLGFFGRDVREPDPEITSLFTALGSQVGQFLKRRQQEDKILRLARIQAVLGSISALIVRTADRATLLEGACRIAVREGGFLRAAIVAASGDPQTRTLALCDADEEAPAAPAQDIPGHVIPALVDVAVATRAAAFDNDFEMTGTHFRSVVALPLFEAGTPIAVLVLYAGSSGFFTSDEMSLLEGLAAELSFALDTVSNRDRLLWMAHFDQLTGLPNRVLFHERLSQALHVAEEEGKTLVVIAGNMRNMGVVNATLGRSAGDEVLREVARRLKQVTRYPDHLARISGDGFATFLPEVHSPAEPALRINVALDTAFREPMVIAGQQIALAMQCGVAVFPADGASGEALLANAETALRRVRGSGQRVSFFEPTMQEQVARRMALEAQLARALAADEFLLHYQPKLALATGRLVGFEALIRWRGADGRLVPPNDFIPLLEESGMIVEVGRWVIRKALADRRAWQQQGLDPPPVAVNVSVVQVREEDFVDDVVGILKGEGTGEAATSLELEITESAAMENVQRTVGQLQILRDLGVGVSIDDFGTGHSSLGYLAQLPVSALKIDRSFVSTMEEKPESGSIVAAVISLAHSLRLEVIAEGVETERQAAHLGALGCDAMQGYLVSRPVDAAAAAAFMRAKPAERAGP